MALFATKKPTLGVWISDHTIEIALVSDVQGGAALLSHARRALKPGIVDRGRVKRPRDLADAFEELLEKTEPSPVNIDEVEVVFGLQDCVARTHVFTLPPHRRSEADQLVHQEVMRNVGIASDTLAYDYRLTHHGEGATAVVVATTSDVLDEWQSFFSSIDIVLREITVESLALFRSMFASQPDTAVCVVDFGQQKTAVSLYAQHTLQYRYELSFGGDSLTEVYAEKLNMTPANAEQHKIKVGIGCGDDTEHEIALKVLAPLVKEVRNALQLYRKFEGQDPTEVVLVGGGAFLKGLVEYLNDQLDVVVRVGQSVFAPQLKPHKLTGTLNRKSGIRGATEQEVYLQPIGFALMGVDPYWSDLHPSFVLTDTDAPVVRRSGVGRVMSWVMLVLMLALGTGAGWVYWQESLMMTKDAEVPSVAMTQEQVVSLEVTVETVDPTVGDVAGRILRTPRTTASSVGEAQQSSYNVALAQLEEGEALVVKPVSEGTDEQDKPIFSWLAYNEEQLNAAYRSMLDVLNTENQSFSIASIEPLSVAGGVDGAYRVTSNVTLVVDQLLSIESVAQAVAEPEPEVVELVVEEVKPAYEIPAGKPTVTINSTPIGHLNARSAPSTSASLVDELEAGSVYEFIEEDPYGWYHIRLDADRTAWIAGQYAVKN